MEGKDTDDLRNGSTGSTGNRSTVNKSIWNMLKALNLSDGLTIVNGVTVIEA